MTREKKNSVGFELDRGKGRVPWGGLVTVHKIKNRRLRTKKKRGKLTLAS